MFVKTCVFIKSKQSLKHFSLSDSRRQTVHDVQRSRLLSSSTLDAYADPTPGSSMQG